MLKHSCMVLEVVIPGLWAWGNDSFSVRGQEMATPLCRAQPGLKRCSGPVLKREVGDKREVRAKGRPGQFSYSG